MEYASINLWVGRHTGILLILKGKESWDEPQHSWTLWTLCWVKQASHKRDKYHEFPHGSSPGAVNVTDTEVRRRLSRDKKGAMGQCCLVGIGLCFYKVRTTLGIKSGLCAPHWRASHCLSSFRSTQGLRLPKQTHLLYNFLSAPACFLCSPRRVILVSNISIKAPEVDLVLKSQKFTSSKFALLWRVCLNLL